MVEVLSFASAGLIRDGNSILYDLTWKVSSDQRWIILGANAAGKTSVLELAAGWEKPTSGSVSVLNEDLASADPDWLRPRVGFASSSMAKKIPPTETVEDAVVTAAYAAAERKGEVFEDIDLRRARRVLAEWKLDTLASRATSTLSEGEAKRLQIARSIMTDPELLLLDEPTAGLDLGSREEILQMLSYFAGNPTAPAIVMVTHHVEEIPKDFTHLLLLKGGTVLAQGPIEQTLTSSNLTEAFDVPVTVSNSGGRYSAVATL